MRAYLLWILNIVDKCEYVLFMNLYDTVNSEGNNADVLHYIGRRTELNQQTRVAVYVYIYYCDEP